MHEFIQGHYLWLSLHHTGDCFMRCIIFSFLTTLHSSQGTIVKSCGFKNHLYVMTVKLMSPSLTAA
jgi:hypothetical protein